MTVISSSYSAVQITALKAVVSSSDANSDGSISRNEAEEARKTLPRSIALAGSAMAAAFSKLDADNSNRISFSELATLLGEQEIRAEPPVPPRSMPPVSTAPSTQAAASASTPSSAATWPQLRSLLDEAIDKNSDGTFTKDELEASRKTLPKGMAVSGSRLAEAFAVADSDSNKRLSLAEITVLLASQSVPTKDTTSGPPAGSGGTGGGETPTPSPGSGTVNGGPVEEGGPANQPLIPQPFPLTGPYATDRRGGINVFEMAGEAQSAEKPYSINYADGILRFEAQQGDRRQKASEVNRAIERSEVSFSSNPFEFGQDYKITFDMMFQGDVESSADNDKFFQIHNVNDAADGSLGPIFAMQLEGDRMRIVTRADADATTTSRVADNWIFEDRADIKRDHWYKFDIALRVDPFGKGMVTVKRDGETIASYEGAIGYNDAKPPYAKVGVYRDTSKEAQVRLYKDLSFDAV